MNTIDVMLKDLNACEAAREWGRGKTWQEIHSTCHRGDWLLWLFKKTMPNDEKHLRLLTLAKARCAETVLHLMKDERSRKAVQVAIAFGEGRATRDELNAAAAAAAAAADAAYAAYAAAAADAAYAAYAAAAAAAADADAAAAAAAAADADAAAAAAAAADAAYAAYAAAAAADADAAAAAAADADAAAAAAARRNSLQRTADICREVLPIEIWNIRFDN